MIPLQPDRSDSLHPPLDVDERVKLYDEAAYGLAAELATHLPDRYMVVENHSDGLGAVDPRDGIQLRPGRTIGSARFVIANPIGEKFIVHVERVL